MYGMPKMTLKSEQIQVLKDTAVNPNRTVKDRRICAKMIYVETGKETEILGQNGKIDIFEPTSAETLKRQGRIETNQSHQNLLTFIKEALVYQLFLLVVIVCGFILLLKKIPPSLLVMEDLKNS